MAIVLNDRAAHEKCFNSPDISKSDSCCLHIFPLHQHVLIGRLVWEGFYNHLKVA